MQNAFYIAASVQTLRWEIWLSVFLVVSFLRLFYHQEKEHQIKNKRLILELKQSHTQLNETIESNKHSTRLIANELETVSNSFHTFIEQERSSLDAIELSKTATYCAAVIDTYACIWKQL